MKTLQHIGVGILTCLLLIGVARPRQRDPLNPLEIDQLREVALDADKRLKLYAQFAALRLDAAEALRKDASATDPNQLHDRLEDFLTIYDEFNDNVENFAQRQADLRKTLKTLLETEAGFQKRLLALKAVLKPAEATACQFVITNALEAVEQGLADHRQLLHEQEMKPPVPKKE
jgi:hypothetical protein